jgi:hypothetical protein
VTFIDERGKPWESAMDEGPYPPQFDPTYFSGRPWADRVEQWETENQHVGFSGGNVAVIRQVLSDPETGLRMVVNITADALRSFLRESAYRNLYDSPVVGGAALELSPERLFVDSRFELDDNTYFGALALGGTGVRFYGEYCMVIKLDRVTADTGLLDRDSYDIRSQPLRDLELTDEQVRCLRGTWEADAVDMALLRVLSEVTHDVRLVTSGTVSERLLRDQEYIEVHLDGTFTPGDLEEVRLSPDDAAAEFAIAERERQGLHTTLVERLWRQRRGEVIQDLASAEVLVRVVTLHGKGYQWK